MSAKTEIPEKFDFTAIIRHSKDLNQLLRIISMNEEIGKSEWIRMAIREKFERHRIPQP
jgi:hypothetical protein